MLNELFSGHSHTHPLIHCTINFFYICFMMHLSLHQFVLLFLSSQSKPCFSACCILGTPLCPMTVWPLFKLSWRWETHYLLQFPITSTLAVTKFPSVPEAQWQALPGVTIQKKGTEKKESQNSLELLEPSGSALLQGFSFRR